MADVNFLGRECFELEEAQTLRIIATIFKDSSDIFLGTVDQNRTANILVNNNVFVSIALNQTEQASSTSTNTISQGNCVARSQLGSLLLANAQTSFTTKSETQNQEELPRHQHVRKVRKHLLLRFCCFFYTCAILGW